METEVAERNDVPDDILVARLAYELDLDGQLDFVAQRIKWVLTAPKTVLAIQNLSELAGIKAWEIVEAVRILTSKGPSY